MALVMSQTLPKISDIIRTRISIYTLEVYNLPNKTVSFSDQVLFREWISHDSAPSKLPIVTSKSGSPLFFSS